MLKVVRLQELVNVRVTGLGEQLLDDRRDCAPGDHYERIAVFIDLTLGTFRDDASRDEDTEPTTTEPVTVRARSFALVAVPGATHFSRPDRGRPAGWV